MPGSLRIGKIAGIDIFLHVSWLIILVLLTWSLATGWFATLYRGWSPVTYWITSVFAALLLFASVLLHELAHALVARSRGLQVKSSRCLSLVASPILSKNPRVQAWSSRWPSSVH